MAPDLWCQKLADNPALAQKVSGLRKSFVERRARDPSCKPRHEALDVSDYCKKENEKYNDFVDDQGRQT
jgi:hypothetical protein